MKRFLFLLVALTLACEAPREASEMPTPYTPNPANHPATSSLPTSGDPVASAVADQAWKDALDRTAWLESHFVADPTALAAVTGYADGTRLFVRSNGQFYQRVAIGTPHAPDGYWLVTSADGGQWIHDEYGDATGQKVAYIGPVPGETTTLATPAGRVNKQFIDHGFFTNDAQLSHLQDSMTSNVAKTFNNANISDLGTLQVGDIVEFRPIATAKGNSAASFLVNVWTEYSEDNGGTWHAITGNNAGNMTLMDASNGSHALALGFVHVVANAGHFLIRIRMLSDNTNQLVVDLDSSYTLVTRA